MITATILGHPVTLELLLDDADEQQAMLTDKFTEMADVINDAAGEWSTTQAEVFRLTNRLTIFRSVTYGGRRLTRSFMAQRERIFYWTFGEFTAWEPPLRRPTAYFHDAWHVRQYLSDGPAPNDEEVLIDREEDAMRQQLAVARALGCDQSMINWLQGYANSRERIRDRLRTGVGLDAGLEEHFLILD